MYIRLSVAFKGGRRGIMDTAPTCLCTGKRERKQNKKKTAQGKAGIGERLGLRQSAAAISESLGTVNGSCSILKCILMALEFRHFINTRKKTWENADGEGAGGRKSWKPPLLFCCLLIVMIGHNVSLL